MTLSDAGAADELFLLDLLNSTPVIDGMQRDLLAGSAGRRWLREHGGRGSTAEREATAAARSVLQDVVRGAAAVGALGPVLDGVRSVPSIRDGGIVWVTEVAAARRPAARAILAWDAVRRDNPGRLRPCANPDCALFLLDHSKPNRGRWCSMAVCGNRMKARRHYERVRSNPSTGRSS